MEHPDYDLHPIVIVSDLRSILEGNWRLSFSKYTYRKQSIVDEREIFDISIAEVTADWLGKVLESLLPNQELALNSVLRRGGVVYHIPMIDFVGLSVDHMEILSQTFGGQFVSDLTFFSSGRSFHAYGKQPISFVSWVKFMGKLLLCNYPGRPQVVDSRWVGHRLSSAYASLRWSKNTNQYRQYPTLIQNMGRLSKMNKREKKTILYVK